MRNLRLSIGIFFSLSLGIFQQQVQAIESLVTLRRTGVLQKIVLDPETDEIQILEKHGGDGAVFLHTIQDDDSFESVEIEPERFGRYNRVSPSGNHYAIRRSRYLWEVYRVGNPDELLYTYNKLWIADIADDGSAVGWDEDFSAALRVAPDGTISTLKSKIWCNELTTHSLSSSGDFIEGGCFRFPLTSLAVLWEGDSFIELRHPRSLGENPISYSTYASHVSTNGNVVGGAFASLRGDSGNIPGIWIGPEKTPVTIPGSDSAYFGGRGSVHFVTDNGFSVIAKRATDESDSSVSFWWPGLARSFPSFQLAFGEIDRSGREVGKVVDVYEDGEYLHFLLLMDFSLPTAGRLETYKYVKVRNPAIDLSEGIIRTDYERIFINGTDQRDNITVFGQTESFSVNLNGQIFGPYPRMDRIVVSTFAGNDSVSGQVDLVPLVVNGGDGDDVIRTHSTDDEIYGGNGNDIVLDNGGVNRIEGGSGDDLLLSGNQSDLILGGEGNDRIYSRGGEDLLLGGPGRDQLGGGSGADLLIGGDGEDSLFGGRGADYLFAGVIEISDSMLQNLFATWNDSYRSFIYRWIEVLKGEVRQRFRFTDDGVSDTLTGGAEMDYFVNTYQGDEILDLNSDLPAVRVRN